MDGTTRIAIFIVAQSGETTCFPLDHFMFRASEPQFCMRERGAAPIWEISAGGGAFPGRQGITAIFTLLSLTVKYYSLFVESKLCFSTTALKTALIRQFPYIHPGRRI
jgi:hypothetical protein